MPAETGHLTSLHPPCYDPNTLWLALNKAKGQSSLVVRRVRVKKKKIQRSSAFLLTPGVSLLESHSAFPSQLQLYSGAWPLLSQGCPWGAAEPPWPGSCAPDSACSSRSVGSGVMEKQSDLSTSSIHLLEGQGKQKENCPVDQAALSQGTGN